MLSARRSIRLNGDEIERTPLLVPSFSSKGFKHAQKIVDYSSELIDSAALISAYDMHYKLVSPDVTFPSLLFLDSGGYEASKDWDLSDLQDREHAPDTWTQELHEAQLAKWSSPIQTVAISYDHPRERLPIAQQIARAGNMALGRKDFVREILLKPETSSQTLLPMKSVLANVHGLSDFDIIGVTEKEIGGSLLDRMKNIALLRQAMQKVDLHQPIHVFGSLDTITTPLYFLAGADIFDGLTWLRFAFFKGLTVYKHNFSALELGANVKSHLIEGITWNKNYYYMKDMELEMRRFLVEGDFDEFEYNGDLFRKIFMSVLEELKD